MGIESANSNALKKESQERKFLGAALGPDKPKRRSLREKIVESDVDTEQTIPDFNLADLENALAEENLSQFEAKPDIGEKEIELDVDDVMYEEGAGEEIELSSEDLIEEEEILELDDADFEEINEVELIEEDDGSDLDSLVKSNQENIQLNRLKEAESLAERGEIIAVFDSVNEKYEGLGVTAEAFKGSHKHTEANCEDEAAFNKKEKVFAIIDGMGGYGGGDVVARACREGIEKMDFGEGFDSLSDLEQDQKFVDELIKIADQMVEATEKGKAAATVMKMCEQSNGIQKIKMFTAGDTTATFYYPDGRVEQIIPPKDFWDNAKKIPNLFLRYGKEGRYEQLHNYLDKNGLYDTNDDGHKILNDKWSGYHDLMALVKADSGLSEDAKNVIKEQVFDLNYINATHLTKSQIALNDIVTFEVPVGTKFTLDTDGITDTITKQEQQATVSKADFSSPEGFADFNKNYINPLIGTKGLDVNENLKRDDFVYVAGEISKI